ncbi:hypothetical protein [Aureivirga sp. CE67]|uniref:hypothetical protein n=1 Tax=Aureivirga sp. CE67 TaxID=1788983 RepID=UPI0018CA886C|nr:hypothetical protein [Aureivirga sp. CE67]
MKSFMSKKGIETQRKEYYITYQSKNYFIKLCESNIEKETLESYFLNDERISKMFSMEVEIKNGFWDICESKNENFQSRIGDYIIIDKINH